MDYSPLGERLESKTLIDIFLGPVPLIERLLVSPETITFRKSERLPGSTGSRAVDLLGNVRKVYQELTRKKKDHKSGA